MAPEQLATATVALLRRAIQALIVAPSPRMGRPNDFLARIRVPAAEGERLVSV